MLSMTSAFCFSHLKPGLGAGFLPAPPKLPSHGGVRFTVTVPYAGHWSIPPVARVYVTALRAGRPAGTLQAIAQGWAGFSLLSITLVLRS